MDCDSKLDLTEVYCFVPLITADFSLLNARHSDIIELIFLCAPHIFTNSDLDLSSLKNFPCLAPPIQFHNTCYNYVS